MSRLERPTLGLAMERRPHNGRSKSEASPSLSQAGPLRRRPRAHPSLGRLSSVVVDGTPA